MYGFVNQMHYLHVSSLLFQIVSLMYPEKAVVNFVVICLTKLILKNPEKKLIAVKVHTRSAELLIGSVVF